MQIILKHKNGKEYLLKKLYNTVVVAYLLENGKKILDKNNVGKQLYDVKGRKIYKKAILRKCNLL